MRRSGWYVRGYYADTVKPPKKPGDLALEVWCASRELADLERSVFDGRDDIGRVAMSEVTR